jgi:hypothetical protein
MTYVSASLTPSCCCVSPTLWLQIWDTLMLNSNLNCTLFWKSWPPKIPCLATHHDFVICFTQSNLKISDVCIEARSDWVRMCFLWEGILLKNNNTDYYAQWSWRRQTLGSRNPSLTYKVNVQRQDSVILTAPLKCISQRLKEYNCTPIWKILLSVAPVSGHQ